LRLPTTFLTVNKIPCKIFDFERQTEGAMKNVHTIQINKATNGFIIMSQGDEPGKNAKFVAVSQDDVTSRLKSIADDLFTPAPVVAPAVPAPAPAAPAKPA
jgi:hypothetical protein